MDFNSLSQAKVPQCLTEKPKVLSLTPWPSLFVIGYVGASGLVSFQSLDPCP